MNRHLLACCAAILFTAAPVAAQDQPAPAGEGPYPIPKAFLGIYVQPTPANAEHPGVVVLRVTPGTPADQAGFERGDLIQKIDGKDVHNVRDFFRALAEIKPGQKVPVDILRDGKNKKVQATLAKRPKQNEPEQAPAFLGIESEEITPAVKQRLNLNVNSGVVVVKVHEDTPASKVGLGRGDVITAANGKDIARPEDLRRIILETGAGHDVTLKVVRGDKSKELKARLATLPEGAFNGPMGEIFRRPFGNGTMERQIRDLEKRVEALEKKLNQMEHTKK